MPEENPNGYHMQLAQCEEALNLVNTHLAACIRKFGIVTPDGNYAMFIPRSTLVGIPIGRVGCNFNENGDATWILTVGK